VKVLRSREVLELLKITRPTLSKYVKTGIISVETLHNGRYVYSKDDVYKLLNRGVKRSTYIYARVSTAKQKADLENQIMLLKQFCFSNGYQISKIFSDIASGINFDKRKEFFLMLNDIISGKVEKVVITYKDRLSRVAFGLFQHLFDRYNCEIVVMSEVGSRKLDSEEIFEEIISLLHCYSMKLYSKRRIQKIREILLEDDNANSESC